MPPAFGNLSIIKVIVIIIFIVTIIIIVNNRMNAPPSTTATPFKTKTSLDLLTALNDIRSTHKDGLSGSLNAFDHPEFLSKSLLSIISMNCDIAMSYRKFSTLTILGYISDHHLFESSPGNM